MHLEYNNPRLDYNKDRIQMQQVTEKDLGVIHNLKWEKQCSAAVRTVNRILGMIKQNFVDRSPEIVSKPYKTFLILSEQMQKHCSHCTHLEYFCSVWNKGYQVNRSVVQSH